MNPIDELIDAALTNAPDPVLIGLIDAARQDIARRHAAIIKSDVAATRCDVQIAVRLSDGTEVQLIG